jgi:hypothetical protein
MAKPNHGGLEEVQPRLRVLRPGLLSDLLAGSSIEPRKTYPQKAEGVRKTIGRIVARGPNSSLNS